MTRRWNLLFALALLAAPAAAQDAPPVAPGSETPAPATEGSETAPEAAPEDKKHENQISEEAAGLLEVMRAAQDTPVVNGLTDMAGKIHFAMDMQGMPIEADYEVGFKAPGEFTVVTKAGQDMAGMIARQVATAVESMLKATLHGHAPASDSEYDAEVKEIEGGGKSLVVTSYKDGKKASVSEFTLDENGVVLEARHTVEAPMMPGGPPVEQTNTATYEHKKVGETWRFTGMSMTTPMAPTPVAIEIDYRTLNGFEIAAGWSFTMEMMGTIRFKFTEMTLNGVLVDLSEKPEDEGAVATPEDTGPPGGETAPPGGGDDDGM